MPRNGSNEILRSINAPFLVQINVLYARRLVQSKKQWKNNTYRSHQSIVALSYKIHISTWKTESTDMESFEAHVGHPKFNYIQTDADQPDIRICKQFYTTLKTVRKLGE